MSTLAGRRALVTGAGVRVGRALAQCCAEAGMDVAVHHHHSAAPAEETAAACRAHGVRAVTVAGDLGSVAGCRAVAAEAERALGGVDVLVNSAANFLHQPFEEVDEAHVDLALAVNLKAPMFLAQAVAPGMRERGWGRIVNMADVAGLEPWPRFGPHCVAKAGVVMLTKVLAQALAPEVLVNAIAPGSVLMPDGSTHDQDRRSADKAVLHRLGTPEDVAGALRYLLEADYVTGHILVVDGGRMVRP
ncbi:MAG: SDR family oxidoreductase [Thermoleophilia bacterium]|nr:SDR family oxidoreductase [Thermoleophilia bacterium]